MTPTIIESNGKFFVKSRKGNNVGGPFKVKEKAEEFLSELIEDDKQIEKENAFFSKFFGEDDDS